MLKTYTFIINLPPRLLIYHSPNLFYDQMKLRHFFWITRISYLLSYYDRIYFKFQRKSLMVFPVRGWINVVFAEDEQNWMSGFQRWNPLLIHTEKYFPNLIKSNPNQIVFTMHRLIWNQMDVRLDPNQSKSSKCNLISG